MAAACVISLYLLEELTENESKALVEECIQHIFDYDKRKYLFYLDTFPYII